MPALKGVMGRLYMFGERSSCNWALQVFLDAPRLSCNWVLWVLWDASRMCVVMGGWVRCWP